MFEVFNIAGDYKDVMNLGELDIYGSKRMGMVQLHRMIQRVDYAGTINTSTGYGSLAAYGYTENRHRVQTGMPRGISEVTMLNCINGEG